MTIYNSAFVLILTTYSLFNVTASASTCLLDFEQTQIYKLQGNSWWVKNIAENNLYEDCEHKIQAQKGGIIGSISKETGINESTSMLFHIPSDTDRIFSDQYINNRSELSIGFEKKLTEEHWYKFSVYFPENFETPDNWFLFSQAWQKGTGTSILAFELNKLGQLEIVTRNEEQSKKVFTDTNPISKGTWHTFVVNLKPSFNNQGYVNIWSKKQNEECFQKIVAESNINIGKLTYDGDQNTIPESDRIIDIKVGISRGGSVLEHQLYFDNLEYGDSSIFNEDITSCTHGADIIEETPANDEIIITTPIITEPPVVTEAPVETETPVETEIPVVTDTTPPIITIIGEAEITITQGEDYINQGATATDDVDGYVIVITSGSVNTGVVGDYTITYTATDQAENTTTSARLISVIKPAKKVLGGHYMFATSSYYAGTLTNKDRWWSRFDNPTNTGALPLPNLDGMFLRINWRDLEPREGVYDFSFIEQSLAFARQYNKKLILIIQLRSFRNNTEGLLDIVPDYVQNNPSTYGNGYDENNVAVGGSYYYSPSAYADKNTIMWWNTNVSRRLHSLIKVIGQRYDNHPQLAALLAEETATGISNKKMADQLGYTADLAVQGLKNLADAYAQFLPRTNTFMWASYLNAGYHEDTGAYLGNDQSDAHIIDLGDHCTDIGVGMGGPDLFNINAHNGTNFLHEVKPPTSIHRALENYPNKIAEWSAKAPFFFAIMSSSYKWADNEQNGQPVARYWTMGELIDYAAGTLGQQFFAYVPTGYSTNNPAVEAPKANIHQINKKLKSP